MKRSVLLAIFALVTLGTPNVSSAAGGPEDSQAGVPRIAVPPSFVDAARGVSGLSGLGLRDQLDSVATSAEFWGGYRDLMLTLADLPHAHQEVDAFMREGAHHFLSIPGVPPHVLGRAYAATAAVGRIVALSQAAIPTPADMSAAMKQAASAFDSLGSQIDARLNDEALPVALRRRERRALRGLVAVMVLGALESDVTDAQRAELLSIYAEGMENLLYLVAADLDGDAGANADIVISELRLPPLDRLALQQRIEDLERAREVLDSTADDLDGERLRLPHDPSFRSPSNA